MHFTSFTTIESYKTKSDKKGLFINRLIDQWFVAIVIQFFSCLWRTTTGILVSWLHALFFLIPGETLGGH